MRLLLHGFTKPHVLLLVSLVLWTNAEEYETNRIKELRRQSITKNVLEHLNLVEAPKHNYKNVVEETQLREREKRYKPSKKRDWTIFSDFDDEKGLFDNVAKSVGAYNLFLFVIPDEAVNSPNIAVVMFGFYLPCDFMKELGEEFQSQVDKVVALGHGSFRLEKAGRSVTRTATCNSRGRWVFVPILEGVRNWFSSNDGQIHGVKLTIFDNNNKNVSADLITTSKYRPILRIIAHESQHLRESRSLIKNDNMLCAEGHCCPQAYKLAWSSLGWDWIVEPASFNAGYCAGVCSPLVKRAAGERVYFNGTAAAAPPLGPAAASETRRCGPVALGPLQITYIMDGKRSQSLVPNMIVERCACQ